MLDKIGHMRFWPDLEAHRRRRLDRAARDWIVRLDAGMLPDRQRKGFEKWIQSDGAHDALERAKHIWNDIDVAVATSRRPSPDFRLSALPVRRRRRMAAYAGITAVAMAAVWSGPSTVLALQSDVRTGPGESRTVELADGSRVELDSETAIAIDYMPAGRRVRLLRGRAAFEVAADPSRPFTVDARGGEVRALGTEFLVDTTNEDVVVTGVKHWIRVTANGASRDVGPRQSLHYRSYSAPGAIYRADAAAESWRRGELIFDNIPLAEIAVSLGRYTDRSLWVLGNARHRRFSGVFRTDDPLAGFRAAAQSSNLRLVEMGGVIIVTER